jgi:hypothetical protein
MKLVAGITALTLLAGGQALAQAEGARGSCDRKRAHLRRSHAPGRCGTAFCARHMGTVRDQVSVRLLGQPGLFCRALVS